MSVITSTSGRIHSEFVRLLFLQAHQETDRFFAGAGVHHECRCDERLNTRAKGSTRLTYMEEPLIFLVLFKGSFI